MCHREVRISVSHPLFELRDIFRARDAVLLEGNKDRVLGLLCHSNKLAHFSISYTSSVATSLQKELLIHATFAMTLREASPIPLAFDLMRFLASSITFVVHLNDVSIFFDEYRIGHLTKFAGVTKAVNIHKALKKSSDLNVMCIQTIQSHGMYTVLP